MDAHEHQTHMRRAMVLAERGWGRVSPNPMVGAVIVRDGVVVGEGWHAGPGTEHAEAMALREAGERANGSTVYSTLEPCNRVGRTPACTEALIAAGVGTVIVAATDPNLGAGTPGLRDLRAAGIDAERGPLEAEARALNRPFEYHVSTGRPLVTLKMAASLDGKTAATDGSSRWITGEAARGDVQRLRAGSDAIVVGANTALADDPHLTVRHPRFAEARPPIRVIVDSAGRVPATGRVFDDAAPTLVASTERAPEARLDEWADAGAEIVLADRDVDGRVSLDFLFSILGKRDVQSVLIEGGASLAWSAVRDGAVHRVVLYLAPMLVGELSRPAS